MAHAYNVSPWELETEGSKTESIRSYMEGTCLKKTKKKKQQKVKGITNALFTDKKPGTHEMQM